MEADEQVFSASPPAYDRGGEGANNFAMLATPTPESDYDNFINTGDAYLS